MRHPQYGRTWWGAQWLLALSQIDHDNRLPRGRSYAHRGAVRDLLIAGGQVSAEVQGSRPRPYRVEIGVPAAEPALVGRLLEALTEDPGLIARLHNHDLDPALLPMAQRLRMPIFPARWSDLRMHCCCPDSAVPCKHLAAAVYLLSQQIDADPFLVFQLRGIDLGALLRQRGVPLDAGPGLALPSAAQALFGAATGPDAPADDNAGAPAADPQALARLDFTAIPDLRQTLWRVLPAGPVFHRGGDFRALAEAQMAGLARQAALRLAAPPPEAQAALPSGLLRVTVDDSAKLN